MKKIALVISALALCGGAAFSQGEMEAYKYAQTDLNGTARYLGMGGAFGALGGDISAMTGNPAGLAVYRSSEVVTTFSLSSVSAKTNWLGLQTDNSRTRVNFDNIAYVGYFPTGNDEGLVSWNVGFSYNRVSNYSRSFTMRAGTDNNGLHTSLSDYAAELSTRLAYGNPGFTANQLRDRDGYDPYSKDIPWMPTLSYNAGFMNSIDGDGGRDFESSFFDPKTGDWLKLNGAELTVTETGGTDKYNFAFGLNFSNFLMFGATVSISDLKYNYNSWYSESFSSNSNLKLENSLSTKGTGYSFNLGAIVRPVDFLRLGVAYNSATWFRMTDYFNAYGSSFIVGDKSEVWARTPDAAFANYRYRTPDKWIFSAAAILGQYGLISVDYELTNYRGMKLFNENGIENSFTNAYIKDDFKSVGTLRVGIEGKITPQFSVRAGYARSSSPFQAAIKDQTVEVITVGTIPHYTVDLGISNYTVGIGYRFTPRFYTDLAVVYKVQKEDSYVFSGLPKSPGSNDIEIKNQGSTLNTNTTRVALSLGYKF